MKRILKFMLTFFYTVLVRKQCKSKGDGLKVNGYSRVSNTTVLGNNIHFNGMKISGLGVVSIGDNFHSGNGCLMISQIHNYDKGSMIPYDDTYICKNILIEDNVWLGDRVIILGGVIIGEGAIIQAGSVVVNDIPKYSIAGGHPAKVFSHRDINHYKDLKLKKKFN
jgi:chloramphenicol O-acetyltransferase type B